MTYVLLNALFVAVALVVAIVAVRRGRMTKRLMVSIAVALALVLVMTAIFDNVMISAGLFAYDPTHVTGLQIGRAPIEDFAYPLAAAILLPSLWVLLGARNGTDA